MKKQIFSLMIGAVAALTSCSTSDEAPNLPQSGDQPVTFNIETPAATRMAVSQLSRYIVEAYAGNDLATPPVRIESNEGSLSLVLKQNTEYTFAFWADRGTAKTDKVASSGYYNTDKLQEVTVTAGKENLVGTEAYCLTKSFNSNDFLQNNAVVLKNATAQLNFTEAVGLVTAGNTLTAKYAPSTLNVATGRITEGAGEVTHTYTNIGKLNKDEILATDLILAPPSEKRLLTLKLQFNTEPEKTITDVPLQQNYKTSLKGQYSNMYASAFAISSQVDDYINNPDLEFSVRVGDFYYENKTVSSTYTANAQNPCIGIVCEVSVDRKSGKIMSLYEGEYVWTPIEPIKTGAYSRSDGAANTKAIYGASNYSTTNYPAFAWCATKNTAGSNPEGIKWYIPAVDELRNGIYANMSILNTSLVTATQSENSKLNGTANYWSSTQSESASSFGGHPYAVVFSDGVARQYSGIFTHKVRLVSAFTNPSL